MVRYPYYAVRVCEAIVRGEAARSILICSTCIGMSIVANRYRGICASLRTSNYMAKMTRAQDRFAHLHRVIGVPQTISLGLIAEAEQALARCGCWNPADPRQTQYIGG